MRWSPTSRASRVRCRCSRPRCSSSGSTRRPAPAMGAYEHAGGVHGAVARLAEARLRAARRRRPRDGAADPAAARRRRRRAACAARPAGRARWRGDRPRSWPCSPTSAWSRSARARSRSRTRRCCASGRGCGAGWRRTPRDAGCIGTSATPRATGRGRAGPGGALPRRAAGGGAGLGGRPRAELSATRARLPRRQPRGERALAAPPAARARRRRRAARARGRSPASSRSTSAATPATRRSPPRRSALGAQALVEDDLDRSLLLARQGVALDDSLQTRGNLLAALLKSPAAIGVLRGDGDRLISLDLSPDERTLAFIDNDGTLTFVDARTRRATGRPSTVPGRRRHHRRGAQARPLRFSPDGSRLAVGGGEPVVLDARTHRVLARLPHRARPDSSTRCASRPTGARCSPPSRVPPEGGTVIQRFDARTGRPLGRGAARQPAAS